MYKVTGLGQLVIWVYEAVKLQSFNLSSSGWPYYIIILACAVNCELVSRGQTLIPNNSETYLWWNTIVFLCLHLLALEV